MISRLITFYREHEFKVNFGASIIAILALYQAKYGLEILLPSNIGWLMQWDLTGYVIVLNTYRYEPWDFPIGAIHNYFYPIGCINGEIIPVFIKLLSPILPEDFQYIGLFLLASHVLVAYYSIKIFELLGIRGIPQLLATLLIVINPVLLYRFVHPSLTAQWLILGSLYFYFKSSSESKPTRVMRNQAIFFVLSGLIFPYLAVMIGGQLFALALKLWLPDRRISFTRFSLYLVSSVAALVVCWYIIGLVSFSSSVEMDVPNSYGLYGWNLSSLYNAFDVDINGYYKSTNLSALLPAFPHVSWHQYEGFSYLGLGMMIVVLIASIQYFRKSPVQETITPEVESTTLYPLSIVAVLSTLFAISNVVTWNDIILFTVPIPSFLQKFGDIFRASGRFFWLPYYLILFASLYFLIRSIRMRAVVNTLLLVVLIIQVYDLKKMIFTDHFSYEPYHTPLKDEHWKDLIGKFEQVMTYPPFETTSLSHDDYRYFTYLAMRSKKPVSTGYLGRLDFTAVNNYRQKMAGEIKASNIHSGWLYITTPQYIADLLPAYHNGEIEVIALDGYLAFYASERNDVEQVTSQIRSKNDQGTISDLFRLEEPRPYLQTEKPGGPMKANMYYTNVSEKFVYLKGWGFIDNTDDIKNDVVTLLLRSTSKTWEVPAKRLEAPDVAEYFHDERLRYAGFSAAVERINLGKEPLDIGISIFNQKKGILSTSWTNSSVTFVDEFAEGRILEAIPEITAECNSNIDALIDLPTVLEVSGWSVVQKIPSRLLDPHLILSSDSVSYVFDLKRTTRNDVAEHFKDSSLTRSGFSVKVKTGKLEKGIYRFGVLLSDSLHRKSYFKWADQTVACGYPEFSSLQVFTLDKPGPDSVQAFIDRIEERPGHFELDGWAFLKNHSTNQTETWIGLSRRGTTYAASTVPRVRKDVADHFKLPYKIDKAGFSARISKEDIKPGEYELSIILIDKNSLVKSALPMAKTLSIP